MERERDNDNKRDLEKERDDPTVTFSIMQTKMDLFWGARLL